MEEIEALHAAVDPVETLFVVDAMQGQDAVNVARAFNEALPLTGVVLTKLDGDARGGAALSVRQVTGKPIKFVGVAREDRRARALPPRAHGLAHPRHGRHPFAGRGGARQGRRSRRRRRSSPTRSRRARASTSRTSRAQIAADEEDGRHAALMDKLPAQLTQAAQASPELQDERQLRRIEGIINSMTPHERAKPELLKASRKRRIAAGAGVQVQEVNRLLASVRADAEDDEDDEGRQPRAA